MKINLKKLKKLVNEKMKEKNINQEGLRRKMKLSRPTIIKKFKDGSFYLTELCEMSQILNINIDEIKNIFE